MLRASHAPLSGPLQYHLHYALEWGEITPGCYAVCHTVADPDYIAAVVGAMGHGMGGTPDGRWTDTRGRMSLALERYAVCCARAQPENTQRALAAYTLRNARSEMQATARFFCVNHMVDSTRGGNMEDYRTHPYCRRNYRPHPRHLAHLTSLPAIRRFMRRDVETLPHRRSMFREWTSVAWPDHLDESQMVDDALHGLRLRERAQAQGRAYMHALVDTHTLPRVSPEQRRVLKRSVRLCCAVIGEEQTRAFAQGQRVRIAALAFTFEIEMAHRVTSAGHGAISVSLLDDTGTVLCGLCVYFDLPVFDQVVAIALHAQSGDELELLRTGNPYAVTARGTQHTLINQRLETRHALANERQRNVAALARLCTPEGRDQADEWYETRYIARYHSVLEELVWHRHVRRYRALMQTAA